ncbi:Coenzyme A disulfide reductase [Anaerohalosphaera lusitana]|uniref:Coenzyme A disulfide reductase n=1 Tax=Anaerohalosphaera lusitana TaxID=1936003 RepID=A0A1U9NJ74_9BACT|nr:FAD-dependent oxidoreductase [Anaerohalosphaera lusitana]AQT67784.1 Coenzyme A disulfide reductase [Anaerohalosphaera lusitana]
MSDQKRILIVGGVAGGASAAARARRLSESAEIIMFERGPYISFANCGLPYHISGDITDRDRLLVQTPESMRSRHNIDVRTNSEVIEIDRPNKRIRVRDLQSDTEYTEPYDTLILSPGAEPVQPPIPGSDNPRVHTLRNIPDMDSIITAVEKENVTSAAVIGAGYIGLEMTEALIQRGLNVSLIELLPQVMATVDPEMAAPLHQHLELHGVDLRLSTSLTSIEEKADRLALKLNDGSALDADIVIMAVGVKPETKLASDASLELGPLGGIKVDDHMRTSDPNIYAVGDAVEVTDTIAQTPALIPLAGPANRQGRAAADNALGRDSAYPGTLGTAICKVFDLSVATTGTNEKRLKKTSAKYEKIYLHPANHAGYYPGASQISLKLIFDPNTGKILGAQATGKDGVDKRIDVIATAIKANLTVHDLQHLELCYAPPYGSAKDPVNYAGFIASNIITGDMKVFHSDLADNPSDDQFLLDVRSPAEVQAGTIPGATNIPIDELRDRLSELPADKEILAFCQVGLRGYLATRVLEQNGLNASNLTGGYKTYRAYKGTLETPDSEEMTDDTGEKQITLEKEIVTMDKLNIAKHVDARGLQCPGPIMELKKAIDEVSSGSAVTITASDPGFAPDVKGWCHSTGNRFISVTTDNGAYTATIVKEQTKPSPTPTCSLDKDPAKEKTIVVFSNDFDKAMATFIIANGAAAMGSKVTLFFTFWGLNLLRKPESVPVKKNLIEKMFGFMMPRGPEKTSLSKMHMAGMGTAMIKGIMKNKNVSSLPEQIANAQAAGVRLVACAMSMDLMGIKPEELIDGVEQGGVAMYLDNAESANVNLFI